MQSLREEAPSSMSNMAFMERTADVFHELMSLLKEEAPRNMESMSTTADVSHEEMSLSKAVAPSNMLSMTTTDDVSHELMSLSKEKAAANMPSMVVTDDVTHDPMSGLHVLLPVKEPPPGHPSGQAQNSMLMSVMRLTSQSAM